MDPLLTFVVFCAITSGIRTEIIRLLPEDYYNLPYERLGDNSLCFEQIKLLNESQADVIQMLDSWAKFPPGLLDMNMYALGDYDECLAVKAPTSGGTVYGKYCLSTLPLPSPAMDNLHVRALGSRPDLTGYHIAFCFPSGCSASDLNNITGGFLIFDDTYCYSEDSAPEMTWGPIITIVIISIFLGIVIVSTVYDTVIFYSEMKPAHLLFVAFSALSNGQKLLSSTANQEQLLCLNGMKAISMMWVLIAHEYLLSINGPVANFNGVIDWNNNNGNFFISNSSVSVDTFFTIGGIVTVYTFLKSMDKGGKFNLPMYYLHRYLRLTPALAMIVLIHVTLLKYLSDGPVWGVIDSLLMDECRKHWWPALLYIQNFVHGQDTCVPQTWYLSIDFQLFVLSPLVLIPLKRWPKYGLALLGILILGGIIIPFVIGYEYDIMLFQSINSQGASLGVGASTLTTEDDLMWKYYKQTHTRYGPYVIGMLAGYYIYHLKKSGKKFRLPFHLAITTWILTITGMFGCLYATFDSNTLWEKAAVMGFQRNAWGAGICIMTFLCVTGHGGPINAFLSTAVFQFLNKLSYSMYLVHYSLLFMRFASSKQTFEFSNRHMMWSFWGDFTYTLLVSAILCLTFESPVIILEKVIFGGGKPRPAKKTAEP